jgi:glycosyltransferase involved in cell wall biosynthesis
METGGIKIERLAVVIPCYNAGNRLKPVAEHTLEICPTLILVDDGSTDGCISTVKELPLELISFPENRGKGHAMLAGFRRAVSTADIDCVAMLDADGQHDPSELPSLHKTFQEEEVDLLIGSRIFRKGLAPRKRRWANRFTAWLTTLLLGQEIADTQSGYRLHSRRLVEAILGSVRGGRYDTEMEILVLAARRGFKVSAAPISTIYKDGTSSSHFSKRRDPFRIYWKLFRAGWKYR